MKTTTLRKTLTALAVASAIHTTPAYAAPGDLDTTFSGDGVASTPEGNDSKTATDVAIQADGKIVTLGRRGFLGDDIILARYNTNGTPDTTFGGDGIIITNLGGNDGSYGTSLAIQVDGKIVVAGKFVVGSNSGFAVVRYNTNGNLDTNFGVGGTVITLAGDYAETNSIAIQANGKIVVVGTSFISNHREITVLRYNANGSLDTSFSGDGIVTTGISGSSDLGANSVAIQADGRIVVVGSSFTNNNLKITVLRYNANGTLDASFSGDGIVTTGVGTYAYATDVAIQADGKIVVAGISYEVVDTEGGTDRSLAVVRYNTNGALDTSFSGDGTVATDYTVAAFLFSIDNPSLAIQADGKIVVAGLLKDDGSNGSLVFRYKTNGNLDSTFGSSGRVTIENVWCSGVAMQTDGKIVLGLSAYSVIDGGYDIGAARLSGAAPDTRLGLNTGVPTGNNIYNLTGAAQTLMTNIASNGGVNTIYIGIQNDGSVPESFKVKGTSGNLNFQVKYFNGSLNVTNAVVAGTFTTGPLAVGAIKQIKARITATTPIPGITSMLSIRSTSILDPSGADKARISVMSN